jgi:polar amino acid transport system substrate-binding protein
MNDFIAKPIDVDRMILALTRCLSMTRVGRTGGGGGGGGGGDDQAPDFVAVPMRLPGIDTEAALKVVRGKHRLLEKGLRMFLERFGDFESGFRSASTDLDREAATREAHSLKGIAANLGMHDVREAAQRLEAACLREPEEIEGRLGDVSTALEPVLEALRARFAA